MCNLLISNVYIPNIQLYSTNGYYKIKYVLPYTTIIGLPILFTNCHFRQENQFIIQLTNQSDIDTVKTIDSYFSSQISNYEPILIKDKIYFNYSQPLKDIYTRFHKHTKDNLSISISRINKLSRYNKYKPIIYIYG